VADEKREDEEPEAPSGASAVGNKTMQVDALLEEVAGDVAVPDDALAHVLPDAGGPPQVSKPPPLPPKRVGMGTIIAGVVIVVLAAGGGIIFGMKFLGEPEATATPAAQPAAEEPAAEALADEGEDEEQLAADEEAEFVPIQLDEVVVTNSDDELREDEGETEAPGE
jgi:hypothetical protein